MPRLSCSYGRFVEIIVAHGFVLARQQGTSHRVHRGVVDGQVQIVVVAAHRMGDDVPVGTLRSMIRQSALDQRLFR